MEELRSILLSNRPSSKQELSKRMVEKSSWRAARNEQAAPTPLGELCLQLRAPCRHSRGWPGPPDPVLSRLRSPPAAALQGPRRAHVLFFYFLTISVRESRPALPAGPSLPSKRGATRQTSSPQRTCRGPASREGATSTVRHPGDQHDRAWMSRTLSARRCLHTALRKRPCLPARCKNLFK